MRATFLPSFVAALLSLAATPGRAALPGRQDAMPAVTSHTGRFMVVMPVTPATPPPARAANAAVGLVELDPNLVAVSCERVKDAFNRALGVTGTGGRRIHVTIAPAKQVGSMPRLVSTLYRDGWQHQLTLPTPLDEGAFVRALVNVLLLQLVDRVGVTTPAEIPQWLAAGLSREVQTWNAHLLVHGDVRGLNHERRMNDPLENARVALAARPALSFDELSWPGAAELGGARRESFESSAHVFTHQLLRLRDGPALCRRFVGGLAGRLNWQTAFLQTYAAQFDSLLAVEKWWAVHVVAFTGRDEWQTWPLDTALARLDDAVRVSAKVRADKNSVPEDATVTLQAVVSQWTGMQQREGVQAALQKLARVRRGVPSSLMSLVDGYLEVLDTLGKRATTAGHGPVADLHSALLNNLHTANRLPQGFAPTLGTQGRPAQPAVGDLVRRLDALDAERAAMREMSRRALPVTTAR
jgi:hypothetical protein